MFIISIKYTECLCVYSCLQQFFLVSSHKGMHGHIFIWLLKTNLYWFICILILRFNFYVTHCSQLLDKKINYCYLCCARRRKSGCCCMSSHRLKGRRPKTAAVKWKCLGKRWKTVRDKETWKGKGTQRTGLFSVLTTIPDLTFMIIAS